ncbi:uncharacterized protein LOC111694389 [Trichogramma pretiosum]|uniref:uncharacterized protein LOC111694389 n=1 Tax=Trichogramma pretiosum TaxID=7493 RepID=UPI000C71B2F1|nr:uncharacterized protein LOC111694389 [Trichogramma pretiosum]
MSSSRIFALGLLLVLSISSTVCWASMVDELTNEQLSMVEKQLADLGQNGDMTCQNYGEKCKLYEEELVDFCLFFSKEYLCQKINGIEDVRRALKKFEEHDPDVLQGLLALYFSNN